MQELQKINLDIGILISDAATNFQSRFIWPKSQFNYSNSFTFNGWAEFGTFFIRTLFTDHKKFSGRQRFLARRYSFQGQALNFSVQVLMDWIFRLETFPILLCDKLSIPEREKNKCPIWNYKWVHFFKYRCVSLYKWSMSMTRWEHFWNKFFYGQGNVKISLPNIQIYRFLIFESTHVFQLASICWFHSSNLDKRTFWRFLSS